MMGGTAGKIKCSDWPTKPPVIDACLLISSLEKNPDLEPKQKKRNWTLSLIFSKCSSSPSRGVKGDGLTVSFCVLKTTFTVTVEKSLQLQPWRAYI